MTKLVANDEQRFVPAAFLDGCVPYDHALGRTEPGDIGVDLVALFAGAHQENSVRRDWNPGILRELFYGLDELWMLASQRLKFVEQGIDEPRSDKDEAEKDGQRGKPEIQPPATRTAPNHGEQDQGENYRQSRTDEFLFSPIPKPGAPTLDGLLVAQRERMPVQANGQMENIEGDEKERNDNYNLQDASTGDVFGEVAEFCGYA